MLSLQQLKLGIQGEQPMHQKHGFLGIPNLSVLVSKAGQALRLGSYRSRDPGILQNRQLQRWHEKRKTELAYVCSHGSLSREPASPSSLTRGEQNKSDTAMAVASRLPGLDILDSQSA